MFKDKNKPIIMMAPMAGITDRAFRRLCLRYGADIVVTEMVSARAMIYGDKKSYNLARLYNDDYPAIIQIFGSDVKSIEFATKEVAKFCPMAIDINMGCPVPKVAGNGDGAGLMRTPKLAGEIISTAVNATDLPITVKIRSGWDSNHINAVEIALIAEQNGAKAVTVHGRTRAQGYEGRADRAVIKFVKDNLKIPVIANGDICDGESALKAIEETGCDGIMVGRGALGSPWVFADILSAIRGSAKKEISNDEKKDVMLEHLDLMVEDKGEESTLFEIRKHMAWYIKGIPNAAAIRAAVFGIGSANELRILIKDIF